MRSLSPFFPFFPSLLHAVEPKTVQIGECSYLLSKDLLQRFAFAAAKLSVLDVRVSLSHRSEVCRGRMTQIGLSLPRPASLKNDLEIAKANRTVLVDLSKYRDSAALIKFPIRTNSNCGAQFGVVKSQRCPRPSSTDATRYPINREVATYLSSQTGPITTKFIADVEPLWNGHTHASGYAAENEAVATHEPLDVYRDRF